MCARCERFPWLNQTTRRDSWVGAPKPQNPTAKFRKFKWLKQIKTRLTQTKTFTNFSTLWLTWKTVKRKNWILADTPRSDLIQRRNLLREATHTVLTNLDQLSPVCCNSHKLDWTIPVHRKELCCSGTIGLILWRKVDDSALTRKGWRDNHVTNCSQTMTA